MISKIYNMNIFDGENKTELYDWVRVGYTQRAHLLAFLSRCYPSYLCQTAERGKTVNMFPLVLTVEAPCGQMTWHIDRNHLDLFSHLELERNNWDGTGDDVRFERLGKCGGHSE